MSGCYGRLVHAVSVRDDDGGGATLSGDEELAGLVDDLLDRADDASTAGAWDEAARLAREVLELDADNVEAAGLLARSERRRRRAAAPTPLDDGERRTVTVTFVDLVNSTALADQIEPETMQEVLRWYHSLVGEAIAEAGGHVARFMGDGAMAYFGYPRATEEAPRQAVHAGLELVARVAERKADLVDAYGVDVDVRVGVHTGLAIIAKMGSSQKAELADIVGETPNIAARLESLAAPGSVMVSGSTAELVRGFFEMRSLGPQQLKGVSRDIEAWRVLARTGATSRLDVIGAGDRSPLVGRRHESTTLLDAWRRAADGHGELFVVTGEAGVGKSRLLGSVLGAADARHLVQMACTPHTVSSPFHPLRTVVGTEGWERRLLPRQDEVDTDQVSVAVRDDVIEGAIQRLLEAATGPMLVTFEDLHWADPSSIEFLSRLAERLEDAPVLVIATTRPELDPWWVDGSLGRELQLPPLDRAAIAEIAEHLAGSSTPALVDWLAQRTAGVPLYLEEVLRSLRESGALGAVLAGETSPGDVIPMTLQGVLLGRLDRLGPAKRTAQVASVVGRVFDVELVATVSQLSVERINRDVRELARAGLIEDAESRYRFRHALIRDAAYESILTTTRRTLHGLIADAIVRGVSHEPDEVVAGHLAAADRHDAAAVAFANAARAAAARSAHSEAIAHINSALAAIDRLDDTIVLSESVPTELSLRLLLGPSLIAARGYGVEEVIDNYERAEQLSRGTGLGRERFDSARGQLSYHLLTARIGPALRLSERVLDLAEQRGEPAEVLDAVAWAGTTRFFAGDIRTAQTLLERVDGLYDPATAAQHSARFGLDPFVLASSHQVWLYWLMGRTSDAIARCSAMAETAEALDRPWSMAHALNYELGLSVLLGDHERALEVAAHQIELSIAMHLPHYQAYAMIFRGRAEADLDPVGAAAQIREGLDMRKGTGAQLALPLHHGLLAETHLMVDDVPAAALHVDAGLEVVDTTGERWWVPELLRLRAIIDHHRGGGRTAALLADAHERSMLAGSRMLAARIATTAAELLGDVAPSDPLHVAVHLDHVDPAAPEAAALRRHLA